MIDRTSFTYVHGPVRAANHFCDKCSLQWCLIQEL